MSAIDMDEGDNRPALLDFPLQPTSTCPLQFDLAAASLGLCHELNISSKEDCTVLGIPPVVTDAAFNLDPTTIAPGQLLNDIVQLVLLPGFAPVVSRVFSPILPEIIARLVSNSTIFSTDELENRLQILASLAEPRPDLWSLIYSFIATSAVKNSPLATLTPQQLLGADPHRLHSLLVAYIRVLTADPQIASRLGWPLDNLHLLRLQHSDLGVRLLAIQALSKQRGWSESKRIEVERESVGSLDEVDVSVSFGYEIKLLESGGFEVVENVVDGWLLPLLEAKRVKALRLATFSTKPCSRHPLTLSSSDLSPRIVLVANTLLLRASTSSSPPSLVHVPTAASTAALESIAPKLQLGLPLLITSPPSSGKTHILQYLSSCIFPDQHPTNRILTIPLADTTIDVKSLIGTYVSSPTKPGTFEWMEGALAKAVRAGRWVVFDDIDRASTEMLVTVAGLARSLQPGRAGRRAKLAVPGREEIEAGEGFALFATRTTRHDAITPPTFFGNHNLSEVLLESPSDEDILAILSASFLRLPRSVTTTLVDIWQRLRPLSNIGGPVKGRDIGLRDLEKWCARVQRNLPSDSVLAALEQNPAGPFANPVLQDEVLLEASDTFMAWIDARVSSLEKRAAMIRVVADKIGMDDERAFVLLDTRRPQMEVSIESKTLRVGRTTMPIYPASRRQKTEDSRPFALTKPSLVLLERIAATASMGEPTLLVGETGTGKTTAVQHIAKTCRKPLTVLNLSTQTESSDLLGGFKPIDASVSARVTHAKWQKLFSDTFSMGKAQNGAYIEAAFKALNNRKWGRLAELWASSARRAVDKLVKKDEGSQPSSADASPRKRRKVNTKVTRAALAWQSLLVEIAEFDLHHVKMKSKLVFSFVEGPLVKALRDGEWLLLDEVNLASQETLEAISTLLEGTAASLVLTERGDVEPIPRHPDFRLFACMNPATDVGKKDLPPNLRARFTELYVPAPDDDREALTTIVAQYLGNAAAGDRAVIMDVVEMYSTLKRLSATKEIVDGSNTAPHFSMRTLARSLMFAVQTAPLFGLRRGLWEGCLMAFTMSLDADSSRKAHEVCEKYLLSPMKNARAVLSQIPTLPASADPDNYVRFGPFWLQRGNLPPAPESRYIITPSVQAKLSDLARVILTHRYPVLIQGPTSAGKTSAVEFLAQQTGHRFVRINNHEHTDIQEYLGTYVTDPQTGNLVFQEGLLVTAVRQGHWIVLDELNLAPTDVLEALNRLLDDNRELVIPETQEVITPHPNFILFATQNPPGLYAGRKVLSRAFRNRFLEVHFDDVPKDELETILCQRCQIAPSYAKKIVQVFEELRHRRQASRVFESKSSFATLRDLFRWAERGAVGYEQLAEDGYMLLAERARQTDDKVVIKQVIEDIMKVSVDEKKMYRLFEPTAEGIVARLPFQSVPETKSMVWTNAMQRLFALVASALAHKEPVLLVGETGCGKTSICEVVSEAFRQKLVGINCHQNMETADLLGSQRPVRNRHERRAKVLASLSDFTTVSPTSSDDELLQLCDSILASGQAEPETVAALKREIKAFSALFEWSDGPLVHAMIDGDLLLLDEVSLADDSVLERLNSVLEPGRTLVLAEKGGIDIDEATLVANDNFHVVATMNPGGDFGKKELSPALRNRFTEIWVPPLDDRDDLLQIIAQTWKHKQLEPLGPLILDFFAWFGHRIGDSAGLGLRDILAWVRFSDKITEQGVLDSAHAFHHGGQMVLVDGLESLPQVAGMTSSSVPILRQDCMDKLTALALALRGNVSAITSSPIIEITSDVISVGGFSVQRGTVPTGDVKFRLEAPTTALNAMRVLRGCQLPKAILLEGSPGVGKTSLVSALASLAGHNLQRINLSDQTDLIDLFGSDLPVEGGAAGEFQWRDAAFLDAMQKGDWVLLDEMNLASQTVLEGLNAVLDHRGTVYIPELGRSFVRNPEFRVFAAQNPLQQGGGRKGLPKSFLNRFTKVYLQEHTPEDLLFICREIHPVPVDTVQRMIQFNEAIREATMVTRSIGTEGSPWEFNLRDLFRWFSLLSSPNGLEASKDPVEHLRLVYLHRFRNHRDRLAVAKLFETVFNVSISTLRPTPFISPSWLQIGHSLVARSPAGSAVIDSRITHGHLDIAESILKCIEMGWLVILAGGSGIGKRTLVRAIADAAGRSLGEFAMHPGVDTSEILGSFEQQDFGRLLDVANAAIGSLIDNASDVNPSITSRRVELHHAREAYDQSPGPEVLSHFHDLGRNIVVALSAIPGHAAADAALKALAKAGPNSTGFAWVDGLLLDAIRNGGWYLISNANLCSASVLDRLNSLCEANGVLVMSEKGSATGSPEVIKPHKDFRLFMTYDPRYGELSRAMRNRGVELYVEPSEEGVPERSWESPTLADHSLLRELNKAQRPDGQSLSQLANDTVLQSALAQPYLCRLLSSSVDGEHVSAFLDSAAIQSRLKIDSEIVRAEQQLATEFVASLPIDISSNPNISAVQVNAAFRALQAYLRLRHRSNELQGYIADPSNAKSVLSTSAAALRRGPSRSKRAAGSEIYPFIMTLRTLLATHMGEICGSAHWDLEKISDVEIIVVLLATLEDRARATAFDYSATQFLADWLRSSIAQIPVLEAVGPQLGALVQAVQITSGQGQSEIWSLFRAERDQVGLEEGLKSALKRVRDPILRTSVLQALVASKLSDEFDSAELERLISDLPTTELEIRARWTNWPILSELELHAIASSTSGRSSHSTLRQLVSEPNTDLEGFEHLATLDSMEKTPTVIFAAILQWLSDTWAHGIEGETNRGPASLFAPSSLSSVLRFASKEIMPMAEIPQREEALRFTIGSVVWRAKERPDSRAESLQVALVILAMILSLFGLEVNGQSDVASLVPHIVAFGAAVEVPWLQCAFTQHIAPVITTVGQQPESLDAIGGLWLGIARFLLELYVTNIPIDPAVRRILLGEVIASRVALLEEELEAVEQGELASKGVPDSRRAADVQQRLETVLVEQSSLGPATSRSTDAARLNILFAEVHSFVLDAFDEGKTDALARSLRGGEVQAPQREEGFQAVTGAFVHRLKANYTDMADLVQPIITAVLFAKFGFRCLGRDLELRRANSSMTATSVLSFPAPVTLPKPARASDTLAQLLSAAALAGCLHDGADRQTHLAAFVDKLDDLYSTWSAIRLREQRETEEADSLYRVKKTDVEVKSDLEQEEIEFKELFPSFEGVGDEDHEDIDPASKDGEEKNDTGKFANERILAFHRLVISAFGGSKSSATKIAETYASAVDELIHGSTFSIDSYDDRLDSTSLAFQIRQLRHVQSHKMTLPTPPNFYLSSNEPEVYKAHVLLSRMRSRLGALIEEWPDQMVLVHLRERVDRVLGLDIRSSVAKVLSALEGLLVHTDDWEAYANKENSLKGYQADISGLIVEWRRLELASWMRLLDDQAEAYVNADAEWTLRLYGALIQGAVQASEPKEHVKTVLPLLNTYLQHSTYGHYAHRLTTLRAFERMAHEVSNSSPEYAAVLRDIALMLHNFIANATLFATKIAESLASQRAALDKSIRDFVKLASWKDINVYALKASAVKSHRHLHRSIRKFRQLLQQPVSPVLSDLGSMCPQDAPVPSPAPASLPFEVNPPSKEVVAARSLVGVELPDHLARLDATFARYTSILSSAFSSAEERISVANDLDEMAVEVIETVQVFAKATPSTLTDENKKIVANLASRKRKAFSDLLKALRASGFSNNVRADQLENQQNPTWLAGRSFLPTSVTEVPEGISTETLVKIESYHAKLGVLMIALRAAFNGHNDDINSQDLQRGIGFVESLYAISLGSRGTLASQLGQLSKLSASVSRLQHVSSSEAVGSGESLVEAFASAEVSFRRLHEALREVEEGVRAFRELEGVTLSHDDLEVVHALRQETTLLVEALGLVNSAVKASPGSLFTKKELGLLDIAQNLKTKFVEGLSAQADKTPELGHLFRPVSALASGISLGSSPSASAEVASETWKRSDDLIQRLLVVAQQLNTDAAPTTKEDERVHVPTEVKARSAFVASLHVGAIAQDLDQLVDSLSSQVTNGTSDSAGLLLARVLPFVDGLVSAFASAVSRAVYDTKSSYKLTYVIGRLMFDLAQRGFCKPSEADDSADGGEEQSVEGTGMGTGTGDKNVSNEITEESQVEGLQGEEEEEKDGDEGPKDEDDAVSMDEDFEGDLGDGKEKEEGGDDDDDDDDDDHDEHVGDVDPLDPGAVDEKFWGDEKKEKEEESGGREDVMDQGPEDDGEAEMTAGDDKKEDKKDKKEEKKDDDKEGEQQQGEEDKETAEGLEGEHGEEEGEGEDDEETMEEAPDGQDEGTEDQAGPQVQDEVALPEGDKLDLPEDLELEDEGGMDEDAADGFDDEPLPEDSDEEAGPDDAGDDAEMASQDDGEAVDDAPPAMEPTDQDANEPEETMNQNVDVSASNDAQAQESSNAGKGLGGADQEKEKEQQEKEDGEDAEDVAMEDDENEAQPPGQGAAPRDAGGPSGEQDLEADGPTDSSGAPLPADDIKGASQPQRSLGDIMKEIKRRRDEILQQQEERDTPTDRPNAPQEAPGQVEYLKDEDEGDDQALGAAGEEERQKLADLNIVDEEDKAGEVDRRGMEVDEEEDEEMSDDNAGGRQPDTSIKREPTEDEQPHANEKALTQADIGGEAPTDRPDEGMDVDEDAFGDIEGTLEDVDEGEDDGAEIELNEDNKLEARASEGEETWRQYAALTGDLSYALCEQLRLILEPTLATRLQGDFRTGKRLNMRKIIPYIASEYTKDKIWLRRTKPSRREYQVLLSLDDSRSMADSHSVHLAYQTLALVSQALNKLEVGQVAIAKFGQSVDILHPFGSGFTDADGAKVMGSFGFDQHKTDVVALVERTLSFLAEARQNQAASNSVPDLWQLQIIISDGVCQDHGRLRTLLRRALEERVMIVFIIIDSLNVPPPSSVPANAAPASSRPSILSMQTVEYKSVNGEMELEMTRYLDTFPFEFFVVLRDVEALPGVLSDTLRQWMARVSQSQE